MTTKHTERLVLIAAHRGTAGGNIPCNTLVSYEPALYDGANVIELDVAKSRDHGWGWLIEKGFDILQTDFTAQLHRYLRERG